MQKTLEYETEEQVMFFDTDIGGVVHNIAYLRMIETCRTLLAEQLGFNLKGMTEEKVFPVVVRTEIDYKKPATLGDKLAIRGVVDEVSKTSFWCEFTVTDVQMPERIFIKCRQRLAIVRMPEGRPMRIPPHIFERFQ